MDCTHELELARKHNIPILIIKGNDITWEQIKRRDIEIYKICNRYNKITSDNVESKIFVTILITVFVSFF